MEITEKDPSSTKPIKKIEDDNCIGSNREKCNFAIEILKNQQFKIASVKICILGAPIIFSPR